MRRVVWIGIACLAGLAAFLAGMRFRAERIRERAIQRGAEQLGSRAHEMTDAVFWLVNADSSNLATMAEGRVPTFAEGAGGLATAIDPAGYFLTAAHAVYGDVHVFGKFDDRWEARKALVVFQGNGSNPADDFCILRVDGPVASVLPLANSPGRAGETLYSVLRSSNDRVVAAGRVVQARKAPANARATVVQTDFLLDGGDSGGPVLNEKGEIIGVNSSSLRNRRLRTQSGLACGPVRSFVELVIRQDQARQRLANPTPVSAH